MHSLFKSVCILFVIGFLVFPWVGCENPPWDAGMVLVLKVDAPKDGATVNTPTITVSGRVSGSESKSAKVTVNDVDAPVTDGKYSANIALTEGKNVINVVATGGQAKPSQQLTVTYQK